MTAPPSTPLSRVTLLLLALLTAALWLAAPAQAQQVAAGDEVTIVTSGSSSQTRVPPPTLAEGRSRAATATIVVTYHGFTPQAQTAFQYAVDIWETLITAPVTIRVDATWEPLGAGILGSCGPKEYWRDFSGAPLGNLWYPVALANQLHGSDLNTGDYDIRARFSSVFTWYLGTDGNCPLGQYDFITVVMHELTHGLGFLGTAGYSGGTGSLGFDGHIMRYDQLVQNSAGTNLTSYTNPSTALGGQLVSDNLYWNGANAKAANGGARPRMYAPTGWNGGSSYSHWNDATYPPGNRNSLMTHALDDGESIHTPGAITLGLFKDVGWTAATLTPKPDAVIRRSADAAYIGDNIYNTTGTSQTVTAYTPNSVATRYYVRVYNDGTASDTFRFKGTAGNASFTVRYYNPSSVDVTADVVSANGWNSPSRDVGQYFLMYADVTPAVGVAIGTSYTLTMTAVSEANPATTDVVKATTLVRKTQPDLQVRPSTSATYVGDNIYNTTGVDQTANQYVRRGGTCTYYVRFYNDGNTTDNIKVVGGAGVAGYNVRYYSSAGTDITASVTGAGWYTGNLGANGYAYLYFRLSPDNTIAEGGNQYIYINGYSAYDSTKRDTVKTLTTVIRDQPDGLLKVSGAATSVGSNVYNTTASGQELTTVLAPGGTADFTVTIQNDGNYADSYTVIGWPGAAVWGVKYYNSAGTDVTAAVVAGTWSTGSLAIGASTALRTTLTPNNTVGAGASQSLLITITSAGTPAKKDAVKPKAEMRYYRPDMHIRTWAEAAYIGDGIYNADGTSQTKTQYVRTGGTARFVMRVQNDANVEDTYTVTGWPGAAGFHVKYFTGGGTEITADVTGSGWKTPTIWPGGYTTLYVQLQPDNTIEETGSQTLYITATSDGNAAHADVVKAVTIVAKDQPDGLIRNSTDAGYIGSNLYNTTAAGQTKTQYAYTGVTVTFNVIVQNDSTTDDTIKVTAPAGVAAWNVKYFDAGGANITAAVVAGTWNTGVLTPGSFKQINVTVAPDATIAAKTLLRLPVYLTSMSSLTKRDVVEADVIKRYLRPDGQIRNDGEAAYSGNNIYNTSGAGQVKAQSVKPTTTAVYDVLVENDGNNPATFVLFGTIGGSGWSVQYLTPDGDGAFNNITASMTGNGYNVLMQPGASVQILTRITPDFTVPSGQVKNVYVTALAQDDTSVRDVVKAVTTCLSGYRPDLQIRTSADASYFGNGIYNTDGTGQTRSVTNTGGSATYYMLVQNDGNAADVMKITGTASSLIGWTVRYYASGYGEITSAVTGDGWTSGTMSPGVTLGLWVTVSANSSAPLGSSKTVTVTATSQTDTSVTDVVKAVTSKNMIIIIP